MRGIRRATRGARTWSLSGGGAAETGGAIHRVVAHLGYAAAEIDGCTLTVGEDVWHGELDYPDTDAGMAVVRVVDDGRPPPIGASVTVAYTEGEASFSYSGPLREVGDGVAWRIVMPEGIWATRGRLSARHPGGGRWTVEAERVGVAGQDEVLDVWDLSASGVAVRYAPGIVALDTGELVLGSLRGPNRIRFPLRLRVNDVRRTATGGWERVAGCAFEDFGLHDHLVVAGMLGRRPWQPPESRVEDVDFTKLMASLADA